MDLGVLVRLVVYTVRAVVAGRKHLHRRRQRKQKPPTPP